MKQLYRTLGDAGFPKAYVRGTLLPDWWDDDAASTPTGFAEAALVIARRAGIGFEALREGRVEFAGLSGVRFKRMESTHEDELRVATSVFRRGAALAALAVTSPYSPLESAELIRTRILGANTNVSLSALLDVCWDAGIPVLHFSRLPQGAKKMDGMVAVVAGRPVIIVARNQKLSAWLSFIIAHELGHVVCGHLAGRPDWLVDVTVGDANTDSEEIEANAFALTLLCGAATAFTVEGWPVADELARLADAFGKRHHIDPGHLALNVGRTMKRMPLGMKAAHILEPNADAISTIRSTMGTRLDWSALPDDSAQFVRDLSGEPRELL